jgi:hypothetical protein
MNLPGERSAPPPAARSRARCRAGDAPSHDLFRLLVALDGEAVVRLGLRADARHLHIEIEQADIASRRDQVGAPRLLDQCRVGLLLPRR